MEKEIVAAASSLFLQYGYKAVTMDDIAGHMRISKKTIYLYFDDKTSLVRSAVLEVFDQVKDRIIEVQLSMDNPIEALYEIKKNSGAGFGQKRQISPIPIAKVLSHHLLRDSGQRTFGFGRLL